MSATEPGRLAGAKGAYESPRYGDTSPGAVCAELPSCNATGHSVRCPRAVATVTIEQIVASAKPDS